MDQEYPKPNKKGWEEKYRYARAYEQAAADMVTYMQSLQSQEKMLEEKANDKTDLNEA